LIKVVDEVRVLRQSDPLVEALRPSHKPFYCEKGLYKKEMSNTFSSCVL
jgi:hypothetical protein